MSGLVGFFRAFLGDDDGADHAEEGDPSHRENGSPHDGKPAARDDGNSGGRKTAKKDDGEYRTSISSALSSAAAAESAARRKNDEEMADSAGADGGEEGDVGTQEDLMRSQGGASLGSQGTTDDVTGTPPDAAGNNGGGPSPATAVVPETRRPTGGRDGGEAAVDHRRFGAAPAAIEGGGSAVEGGSLPPPPDSPSLPSLPIDPTPEAWRQWRTSLLERFMEKRMVRPDDLGNGTGGGDDSSLSSHSDDGKGEDWDDGDADGESSSESEWETDSDAEEGRGARGPGEDEGGGEDDDGRGDDSQRDDDDDDNNLDTQDVVARRTQQSGASTETPGGGAEAGGRGADGAPPPRRRRRERRRGRRQSSSILHVDDTSGTCTSVPALSLRSRTVDLRLCRVDAVWPLRKTRRMEWQDPLPAADGQQQLPSPVGCAEEWDGDEDGQPMAQDHRARGAGNIPVMRPYSTFEDDGPLCNIFKQVLSLELTDLEPPEDGDVEEEGEDGEVGGREADDTQRRTVQEAARAIFNHGDEETANAAARITRRKKPRRRRVRLFLYNRFATHMSELLKEWDRGAAEKNGRNKAAGGGIGGGRGDGGGDLLLSLRNVPARCVLPYTIPSDGSDPNGAAAALLDEQYGRLSDYALCVGSRSFMFINMGDDEEERGGDFSGREADSPTRQHRQHHTKKDKVRFDAPGIEIRCVRASATAAGAQDGEEEVVREVAIGEAGRRIEEEEEEEGDGGRDTAPRGEMVRLYRAMLRRREDAKRRAREAATATAEAAAARERADSERTDSARRAAAVNDPVEEAGGGAISSDAVTPTVAANNGVGESTRQSRRGKRSRDDIATECADDDVADDAGGAAAASAGRKRPRVSIPPGFDSLSSLRSRLASLRSQKERMRAGDVPFQALSDKVDVCGSVLSFTPPHRTKSGDWMVSACLVDESLSLPAVERPPGDGGDDGAATAFLPPAVPHVTIIIFNRDIDRMPRLLSAGDVLRCRRVIMQEWKEETQLVSRRFSSFAVLRPRDASRMLKEAESRSGVSPNDAEEGEDLLSPEDPWNVSYTAENPTPPTGREYDRARELWVWTQKRLEDYPTTPVGMRFFISQMGRQDDNDGRANTNGGQQHDSVNGDLTALVTAVIPIPPSRRSQTSPRGFLRVWDGTGPGLCDPVPLDSLVSRAAAGDGADPPSEVLVKISDIVSHLNDKSSASDAARPTEVDAPVAGDLNEAALAAPTCLCGRVVNVAVWEDAHWEFVAKGPTVGVGTPLRLRNIRDGFLSGSGGGGGLRCLMVHPKSSVTPLPRHTYEVRRMLAEHGTRVGRGEPYNSRSGLLPLALPATERGDDGDAMDAESDADDTSLSRCLSEPAPFRLRAQFVILGTYPPVEPQGSASAVGTLCVRNADSDGGDGSVVFRFALRLLGDSARLEAIVPNNVAEALLGVNATDASATATESEGSENFRVEQREKVLRELNRLTRKGSQWEGYLKGVSLEGEKFFVLDSVPEEVDNPAGANANTGEDVGPAGGSLLV